MKTSAKFKKCDTGSAELHNQRDPEYLRSVEISGKKKYDIFHDRTSCNTHWTNPDYAAKSLDEILDEMRRRYRDCVGQAPQEKDRTKIVKGRKKIVAGWSPIREACIPVLENTKIEDFKPFSDWLESKGITIISIDIHLDEGHVDYLSGERKYNRHAHVICNWTDPQTGKTRKLTDADTSEMQTQIAAALGMERGKPKSETGIESLPALEYREKKAAEHLIELQGKLKQAMIALETVEAQVELADAKKQELRVSLYDTLARIGNLFGKGAIAAAQSEMKEAKSRAIAAEAASRQAESLAAGAKRSEAKAKNEKAKYGREMYEMGLSEGRRIGVNSRNDEVRELKRLHNELIQRLDKLQQEAKEQLQQNDRNHKNQLDAVTAQKEQVILELQKFQDIVLKIFPNLENIEQNWQDMKSAGLSSEQRRMVLTEGSLDTVVQVPLHGKKFKVPAKVEMARSKQQKMHVWFNRVSLRKFMDNAIKAIKTAANKGLKK